MAGSGPLRWGIIGCGDVVERKSGPSIEHAAGSQISFVMRRDAALAQAFAAKHDVPEWTTDAAAVVASAAVDVVYVATPPSSHHRYVLAAAAAGKPVVVEKPMALSAAEAEEMCEACADAGVELFVAYYRRFQPHVAAIRELLEAGALGEVVQARIDLAADVRANTGTWRHDPAVSGGGSFVDLGSHRLDLMVSLLGPVAAAGGVATVSDDAGAGGVERAVAMSIRFASGVVCSVSGDFASGRVADHFSITGDRLRLVADPLDGHAFSTAPAGAAGSDIANMPPKPATSARVDERLAQSHTFDPYPAPHLGLVRHVEAVLRSGVPNRCSGTEAIITERLLDQVVRRPAAS